MTTYCRETILASEDEVIGALVGVPLGIVLGRYLQDLFTIGIAAVPDPTVPVLLVVSIRFGATALGNFCQSSLGVSPPRTSTAVLLRAG